MKKILFTLSAFCGIAITANAQITVTSADYLNATTLIHYIDTLPNAAIDSGLTGASQTYDFSLAVKHLTSTTNKILPKSSGLLAASYPSANLCLKQDAKYYYFDSTNTKIDFWGISGDLLEISSNRAQVYTNPEIKLTFPSTYTTTFTDPSSYDNTFEYMAMYQGVWVDSVRNKENNTTTSLIDGWGSVITPDGTYPCLRQNVLVTSIDSSWAKIFVGGFHYWIFVSGKTSNFRSYHYISNIGKGPIVSLDYYADSSAIERLTWNNFSLSATTAQTNALCNGGTGSATASVVGGTPPYTYLWSPGGQTTATATGLSAGSYTLEVTDAIATQTTTATFTITAPAALTATVSASTNVLCNGNSNGSATALAGGGTTPYAYLWNDPGTQATAIATGLAAGNYGATITDANGCANSASVTITQPSAALTATVSASTNILCWGNTTGAATASASGGTGAFTYSWNTIPVKTTATITGLSAGNYIVTVKDANNCSSTASITITQPAAPVNANITSQVNVLCRGNSTGSATLTANGGTAPLTYLWNNGQTTTTATGLAAGNYTATVTDANGCVKTAIAAILQPATALTASVSATTNVLCFGNSTGSATAAGSGGTGTITYLWNDPGAQTTATATGLTAGDYTATVTDANSCATTVTVTITEPATVVSASMSATNVLCKGNSTGDATASGSGGTGSFTYLWNDPGTQATATATGLAAGDYTATITDANGCATTRSVTITEPATVVTASTSVTDATCGNADGTATATASGGTGTLTYLWNDPGAQTTPTATGLLAASYTVTVTDANGCSLDAMANVSNIGSPTVTIVSQTNVTCNGGSNGDATATATGGTAPLTYLWNDPGAQTTLTATSLPAGTYNLTVTDGLGCIAIQTVTINEPTAVTASITATNVNCNGGNDGSATAAGSGGTGAITYLWSDGAAQTTATAIGLTAGDYTVTATDASGCASTATVTITEPSALTATATATAILCNGGTSVITVSGSGGTPSYTGEGTFTVTAGTYSYTVTDNNGCAANTSITVTEPTVLTTTISVTNNVSCNGGSDGSAAVAVGGGTGTYTYLWSNGSPNPTAGGLSAADYTVTVTDANGCSTTATVTVTEPAAALTASVTIVSPTCGIPDGSATATPTGGTGPYTYSWNTSPVQTTPTATGLPGVVSQTLVVTVTDANGCTLANTYTVLCVTGVIENNVASSINVYPNPSSGNITIAITVANNEDYTVKVMNLTGQIVYNETIHLTTGNNVKTINLESYSDGLYMIQLISKDQIKYLPHMIAR